MRLMMCSLVCFESPHNTYHGLTPVHVAMRDALAKDSRLHRDISVGNIILVQETGNIRKGYLVDWDASCRVDDSGLALEEGRAVRMSFCFLPHVNLHIRC